MPTLKEIEQALAAQGQALEQGGQQVIKEYIDEPLSSVGTGIVEQFQPRRPPAKKPPGPPMPIEGAAKAAAAMQVANMYDKMRHVDALTPEQREERARFQEEELEKQLEARNAAAEQLRFQALQKKLQGQ